MPTPAVSITERKPTMTEHSPPVQHPGWCCVCCCASTDVDVQHRSSPVARNVANGLWTFQLVRGDEHASRGLDSLGFTRHLDDIEVLVTIETDGDPVVQVVLPVRDVEGIRDALGTERARAQFLSAPVVHELGWGRVA